MVSHVAVASPVKEPLKTPDTLGPPGSDDDGYSDMDIDTAPAIRAWQPLVDGGRGHKVTIIDFAVIEQIWSRDHGIQADVAADAPERPPEEDDNDDDDDADMDDDDDGDLDGDDGTARPSAVVGSASSSSSSSSSSSAVAASAASAGGGDSFAVPDGAEMRGAGRMLAVIHKYQAAAEDQLSTGYDDGDSFIDDEQVLRDVAQRNETKTKTLHGDYFVHQGARPIEVAGDDAEEATAEALDAVRGALDAYLAEHSGDHLSLGAKCDQLLAELRSATAEAASQTPQRVLVWWPYHLDAMVLQVEAEALRSHIPRVTEHAGYVARLLSSLPVSPAAMMAHLDRLRRQRLRDALFERTAQLLEPLRRAVAARLASKPVEVMQREEADKRLKADQRRKVRDATKAAQSAGKEPPSAQQIRAIESSVAAPEVTGLRWFQMDSAVKAAVREYVGCVRSAIEAELRWRECLRPADRENEARKARLNRSAASPVQLGSQQDGAQGQRERDPMPESFLAEGYREKRVVAAFLARAVDVFPEGSVNSTSLRALLRYTRKPAADAPDGVSGGPTSVSEPAAAAAAAAAATRASKPASTKASSSSSASSAAPSASEPATAPGSSLPPAPAPAPATTTEVAAQAARRGLPISASADSGQWAYPSAQELRAASITVRRTR